MPNTFLSMSPQLVLLVEDDELLRSSLEQLLQASGYEVKGFSSGRAVLDLLRSGVTPQVDWALVILDVHLAGDSGLEVQKALREMGVGTPFVFISAHQNAQAVNQAWRGGAHSFLFKPFTPEELLQAVKQAIATHDPSGLTSNAAVDRDMLEKFKRLTPRQKEVLRLVARGQSNTQIAAQIGLAPRTVKMHRESMMHRFGFSHVTDLVRFHDACKHLF